MSPHVSARFGPFRKKEEEEEKARGPVEAGVKVEQEGHDARERESHELYVLLICPSCS